MSINYIQVNLQTNKVVAVSSFPNLMVETESLDNRVLGCRYDPETGTFSGHKISLTAAAGKSYIMADGVDTIRITATIKTWDDQDANAEFTDPIMFVVDGVPKLVTKKTAGYYVDYKTTTPGTKQIATQDEKFISQGSVAVLAVEVDIGE